jgi:hypothetical protein
MADPTVEPPSALSFDGLSFDRPSFDGLSFHGAAVRWGLRLDGFCGSMVADGSPTPPLEPADRPGPSVTAAEGSGDQLGRRARLDRILERDEPTCVWCRRPVAVGLVEATTEHVIPRVKGGPSRLENEVAACRRCNARRGHRSPAEWAERCDEQGWNPDRARLIQVLTALERRIETDGGLRRVRPYLRNQLRRLQRSLHPR